MSIFSIFLFVVPTTYHPGPSVLLCEYLANVTVYPAGPSRTRLVEDLTPKSDTLSKRRAKEQLVVAPRKRETFSRDPVPHAGAKDRRQEILQTVEKREQSKKRQMRRDGSDNGPSRWRPPTSRPLAPSLRLSSPHSSNTRQPRQDNPRRMMNRVPDPPTSEFVSNTNSVPTDGLPIKFTSPPLMEGLLSSVVDILGPYAKPTPIQALSLKHVLKAGSSSEGPKEWVQYLLASETGSGKSMAYLLPVIQDLKLSELNSQNTSDSRSKRAINPRALVLAPTHELSRQLSGFAKSLLHNTKLRVMCASRANVPSVVKGNVTASKMASTYADPDEAGGEFEVSRENKIARPVDVLVGTPSKLLEMARGHGWNWEANKEQPVEETWDLDERGRKIKPKKTFIVGQPEVGLENIEWVVVDEADVLFGLFSLAYCF